MRLDPQPLAAAMSHIQANPSDANIGQLPSVQLGYPDYFHQIRLDIKEKCGGRVSDENIKLQVSLDGSLARAAASANAAFMGHKEAYARFQPLTGTARGYSLDRYLSDIHNLVSPSFWHPAHC
jgi:hypothetical protein